MKIEDIPALIYFSPGGVMIDLDDIEDTLARFKNSYGLDLDPDFQRGHVWKMETKVKFIEYILRGGVVPPLRFNSPVFGGNSRKKGSDLPDDVVLVDGKQRLNACREFINNEVAVFGGNYLKDFDDPQLLLRKTSMTYSVNKLQTRRDLLQWYLEMNEGQVAHSAEELDRVRSLMDNAK